MQLFAVTDASIIYIVRNYLFIYLAIGELNCRASSQTRKEIEIEGRNFKIIYSKKIMQTFDSDVQLIRYILIRPPAHIRNRVTIYYIPTIYEHIAIFPHVHELTC